MDFSERLRFLRTQKGLSQKKVADLSGLSQASIYQWEKGTRKPKYEQLQKLAKSLGTTVPYLLGEEGIEDDVFQEEGAFIDFLYTIGYSVETCLGDPKLGSVYFVRHNDEIYTISPANFIRLENLSKDMISMLIQELLQVYNPDPDQE